MWLRILSVLFSTTALAAGQQAAPLTTSGDVAEKTAESKSAELFVPVTQDRLNILKQARALDSIESSVKRLTASAELVGLDSMAGHLDLVLDDEEQHTTDLAPISLGITNLQNLRLFSDDHPVNFANDEAGNLIALSRPGSRRVTGTWARQGTRSGISTIFQLEFPPAAICDFELKTASGINVTSPNALVIPEASGVTFTTWKIRPDNTSRLTISCTQRSVPLTSDTFAVSAVADIRIELYQTHLSWAVTTPASFALHSIDFQFSEACVVTDVIFPENVDGTWSGDPSKNTISVTLPASSEKNTLRIMAVVSNENFNELKLPFLMPQAWRLPPSETQSPVSAQSTDLQVSISPALLLTHVDLEGVYEDDVAHSTDGTQTLNLVQFTTTPQAKFFLTRSRPIIHDATVIVLDPKTEPGKATAYVSIEAKTGHLGEAEWTIPAAWRVTDVKEVSTGFPILFRVKSAESSVDATVLHAYLRTPVVPSAAQTIQIALQSAKTGVDSQAEPPSLGSETYHRQFDFLATHERTARVGVPSEITGIALLDLAPWLPASVFKEAQIFERSTRVLNSDNSTTAGEEIFATIDYTTTRNGDVIKESVRLRIRRRGGVPNRIPLSVTPGVDIAISGDSPTQPAPLLNRTGDAAANWLLQLPLATDPPDELNVLLITSRTIQPQLPATVVSVNGSQQSGGSIQPPTAQEGVSLQMSESEDPIRKTISYPVSPPWGMKLKQLKRDRSAQRISGTVFRILSRNNADDIEIETAVRLQVDSADTDSFLNLRVTDARDISTSVNGRQSFADISDGLLTIPLDRKSRTNVIDLHFHSETNSLFTETLLLSPVNCPESDSQRIVSFTLFPSQSAVVKIEADDHAEMITPDDIDGLLNSVFGDQNQTTVAPHITSFVSRWNTCAAQSETVLITATPPSQRSEISITLRDTRFDMSLAIIFGIACAIMWRFLPIGLWVPGFCLIIAAGIAIILPDVAAPWLNGFMGGTGCQALIRATALIPIRRHRRQLKSSRTRIATATILFCISSIGTNRMVADEVSTASGIQNAASDTHVTPEEALVVNGDMTVYFESPQSIRAEIHCMVATHAEKTARLNVPLKNVTLISCAVDGKDILPSRDSANRTQVLIPGEAVVPRNELKSATPHSGTAGPSALDGWLLRHVTYTIRTVPRGSKGTFRIVVPYPPAPEMKIQLIDPTRDIQSAEIADQPRLESGSDGHWEFPTLFSRKSADLSFHLRASPEKKTTPQQSVGNCNAEVSPQLVKLTTTYIVKPASEDADRVRVSSDARYAINSITTVSGDTLQWSSNAEEVIVQLAPNSQGIQHFVIGQSADIPLNLTQPVHLDRIRNINGQQANTTRLSVSTTDRFAVESVALRKSDEKINAVNEDAQKSHSLTTIQSDINIPPDVNSATVRLVQRKSNWEAYLQQSAVVQEDAILWNCVCKMDVSGRPVYRQRIRIPDFVKISNVTASSSGVSRLQSWTRTGDSVILTLREPTRGTIEMKVEGKILRSGNSDTMLPNISLPDAQTLESGLELSAEPQTDAYIRSLGSAIPHIAIDVAKEIIPTKPIRLSILDEAEQVIIRARPDQKLSAEVAVLIYDSGGQPLLAQFIALHTVEATFDIRFRLQNDGYPDVNPNATRDGKELKLISEGNEFVLTRADRSQRLLPTILVIPDMVPPEGQRILPVSLPKFDAEIEIQSHSVFDLRSEVGARMPNVLPAWLSTAVAGSNITEETAAVKLTDYQFDGSGHRFQIAPIQQVRTEAVNPKRVVSAVGIHVVHSVNGTAIVGQSGMLTFCSDFNSVIRLSLPPEAIATQIRVNGQPQTISPTGAFMEVTGPEKINHVLVTWTANHSVGTGNMNFALPGIVDINSDALVVVIPPAPKPFFWSVGSQALSESDFGQRIAAGLKRSVRSVNPAFRPKDNGTEANDTFNLDTVFWDQIEAESPAAATTFKRTAKELHKLSGGDVVLTQPTNGQIEIQNRKVPAPLETFSLLIGVSIVLGSCTSRWRKNNSAAKAESMPSPSNVEPDAAAAELSTATNASL